LQGCVLVGPAEEDVEVDVDVVMVPFMAVIELDRLEPISRVCESEDILVEELVVFPRASVVAPSVIDPKLLDSPDVEPDVELDVKVRVVVTEG
jgi:hypothetical protein